MDNFMAQVYVIYQENTTMACYKNSLTEKLNPNIV